MVFAKFALSEAGEYGNDATEGLVGLWSVFPRRRPFALGDLLCAADGEVCNQDLLSKRLRWTAVGEEVDFESFAAYLLVLALRRACGAERGVESFESSEWSAEEERGEDGL
jgi:hypothetical protein